MVSELQLWSRSFSAKTNTYNDTDTSISKFLSLPNCTNAITYIIHKHTYTHIFEVYKTRTVYKSITFHRSMREVGYNSLNFYCNKSGETCSSSCLKTFRIIGPNSIRNL